MDGLSLISAGLMITPPAGPAGRVSAVRLRLDDCPLLCRLPSADLPCSRLTCLRLDTRSIGSGRGLYASGPAPAKGASVPDGDGRAKQKCRFQSFLHSLAGASGWFSASPRGVGVAVAFAEATLVIRLSVG